MRIKVSMSIYNRRKHPWIKADILAFNLTAIVLFQI